jgi:hypothetical protein
MTECGWLAAEHFDIGSARDRAYRLTDESAPIDRVLASRLPLIAVKRTALVYCC